MVSPLSSWPWAALGSYKASFSLISVFESTCMMFLASIDQEYSFILAVCLCVRVAVFAVRAGGGEGGAGMEG